jgi:predicted RNase H-like nuclease (RuvC/YqgF family)
MLTLNETRTQLRVGRRRLMLLLDELQIKPVQVHAKRQEITPEQFQQLQQHLHGTEDPQPDQTTSTSTSTTSSTSSTSDSTTVQPVVELLEQQVTYLKQEIEGHKEEKRELLQSNDRIQQLLSVSMSEGSKLRAELDRMRMLEHQPITQTAEQSKDIEDILEGVDPVIAETAKSNGWTWPVLTMGILAVGCWVVLQISPESQLRIAELVRW